MRVMFKDKVVVFSFSNGGLHLSGDLRLSPRAALNLLQTLADHLQGGGSSWFGVSGGFLAAAQLWGALSPAGELALRALSFRVKGDELGLDGGGVDALVVEEVFDPFGHVHVGRGVVAFDVRRGDDSASRQLPDVHVVDGQDAVQAEQALVEAVHVDLLGDGLQQDEGGLFEQRVGGVEQDAHHDDAQRGIQVEHPAGSGLCRRVLQVHYRVVQVPVVRQVAVGARVLTVFALTGLPHKCEDDGVHHHDDGAQGVPQHVEEDAAHVELRRRIGLRFHLVEVGVAVHLHLRAVFTADLCRLQPQTKV